MRVLDFVTGLHKSRNYWELPYFYLKGFLGEERIRENRELASGMFGEVGGLGGG